MRGCAPGSAVRHEQTHSRCIYLSTCLRAALWLTKSPHPCMYVEGLGTCALPGLGFRGVCGHDCDAPLPYLVTEALPLEGVSFRWGGGYFLKRVSAALERGAALSMNRLRLRQHTFLFCHAAGSVVGTPRALLGQPVLYFCPRFCGYVSLFPVSAGGCTWLVGNTFRVLSLYGCSLAVRAPKYERLSPGMSG